MLKSQVNSVLIDRTACRFLPPLTRQALDTALFKAGVHPASKTFSSIKECKIDAENVIIGDTVVPRYQTRDSAKVPNVLFYDLPQVRMISRDFWVKDCS